MAVLCLHPGSELRSHLRLDRRMVGYGFVRGCCPGVSPGRWLQVTRVPWLHDWGSLCACAVSLQAVLKGVPSSPLALLWVPISTAYLGCFRRPPAATAAAIAQTCPRPWGTIAGWALPCAGHRSSSTVLQLHPTGERCRRQSPPALGRRWGC